MSEPESMRSLQRDLAAEREKSAGLEARVAGLEKVASSAYSLRAGRQAYFDALTRIYVILSGDTDSNRPHVPKILKLIDEIKARVAGLETILADAPHRPSCRTQMRDLDCEMPGQECGFEESACRTHRPSPCVCDCWKSLDPLKVGQAVMAALQQAIKSMEEHRCGLGTCHVCVSMKACKDALVSAGTEGQ